MGLQMAVRPLCPQVFEGYGYIPKHMDDVHYNVCPSCNKIFAYKNILEVHFVKNHNIGKTDDEDSESDGESHDSEVKSDESSSVEEDSYTESEESTDEEDEDAKKYSRTEVLWKAPPRPL